jgi:hypothetical protein
VPQEGEPVRAPDNETVNGFVPVDVGPEPRNHTELLMQHDRRLFNLENGIAEALGVLNANVSILTEGYNSLSASSEGSQAMLSLQGELRAVSERIKALEAGENRDLEVGVDEVHSNDDQDDEVSITFSTQ